MENLPSGAAILAVPVPFHVWLGCRNCQFSAFKVFPKGRPTTPIDKWALPCPECRSFSMIYASYIVTAN